MSRQDYWANPHKVFALGISEDIPNESIQAGDLLICDYEKRPQPGDFAILPFGPNAKRLFLCKIHSLTMDRDTPYFEVANPYPIPEGLIDKDLGQEFNWLPLALTENNHARFDQIAEETGMPLRSIPPDLVVATVLRLTRNLSY